jgi:hypothetical protein
MFHRFERMTASEQIVSAVNAVAAAYPAISEDEAVIDYISGVTNEWY